jgi:M6 family metalloprotease-like protein
MRFKCFFIIMGLAVFLLSLGGSPGFALQKPTPEQIEGYRADGTLSERIANATALGNHLVAPKIAQRLQYKIRRLQLERQGVAPSAIDRALSLPPAWRGGLPSVGMVRVPVLLVAFSDHPPTIPRSSIEAALFGDGSGGYPYESLRNYYRRSSYGQLEIVGDVLGWYITDYPQDEVVGRGQDSMIKEVLGYYKAQGHDFSQYDNDGDGIIDDLIIIWSGEIDGFGGIWWSYHTPFGDSSFTIDGKKIGKYSWTWETDSRGRFDASTIIHETGHALGLPDYYDYSPDIGPRGGIGYLDMMDAGRGDHNCFSKLLLEWIDPVLYSSGSAAVSLLPSGDSGDGSAIIVMPGMDPEDLFSEFFMVQNRYPAANDVRSVVDGLLIWHVDGRLDGTGLSFLYNNSLTEHKLLRLMEADGLEEIETKDGSADPGDFYVPGRIFSPSSVPNSNRYDGSRTGIVLRDMALSGSLASFSVSLSDFVTDKEAAAVSEGGTGVFQIKLVAPPSSPVEVAIGVFSGDTDITVQSGAHLTFTPDNWDLYHTVTLAAAPDADTINGTAIVRISAPGLQSKDITATEADLGPLSFVIDRETVTVPESGVATFRVKLGAVPSSDVAAMVSRVSGDPDITVQAGAALNFSFLNWDVYQTVTLAAAHDSDVLNGTATIRISAAGLPSKDLSVVEADEGAPVFITDKKWVTVPEAGTATFRVRLYAPPSSTVTAAVARVDGDTDITVQSGTTLTFTPSNWNVYQTVTLAAVHDADHLNGSATIRISAPGLPIVHVTASEADDDALSLVTSTGAVTIAEGSTATFQVKLSAPPASPLAVTVARVTGDPSITVQSGASLTFTPADWSIYKTVTLAAAYDADVLNGSATIRISAPGLTSREITATEIESSAPMFVTSVEETTVPDGGTATFQVKLSAAPEAHLAVVASLEQVSGAADIIVESGSVLTFTSSNWGDWQTVTLRAAVNPDAVGTTALIEIRAVGFAAKPVTARVSEGDLVPGQWVLLGPPESFVYDLAVDPANRQKLYSARDWGVYRSVDGGSHWKTLSDGSLGIGGNSRSLALDSRHPGVLYATSWSYEATWMEPKFYVYKSTDGGGSWLAKDNGLFHINMGKVAIAPSDGNILYASTWEKGPLFRSENGGESWEATGNQEMLINTIAVDPADPQVVYVAILDGGLLKTTDGGFSWRHADYGLPASPVDIMTIAIDPGNPKVLCAGTDAWWDGLFKSTDGGANWLSITVDNGFTLGGVTHLAIDPLRPRIVYAASLGVQMTQDGGITWEPLSAGLPVDPNVTALAIDPAFPEVLYAAVDTVGIFRIYVPAASDGISPSEGTVSSQFTIRSSTPFGAKGKVLVGNVAAKVLQWNATTVVCQVSKPMAPGVYVVTVLPKKAAPISFSPGFTIEPPLVEAIDPASAGTGVAVNITGKFFGLKKGKVYLGTKSAKVVYWNMDSDGASRIQIAIPKGLTPGTDYQVKVVVAGIGEGVAPQFFHMK